MCRPAPGALVLSTLLLAGGSRQGVAPMRLAIYYGYPSLVNGASGDLAKAAAEFSVYDVLVFGDGLEFDTAGAGSAGPVEHARTARLIAQLRLTSRRPTVFGYVDLGRTQRLTLDDVIDRIGRWARMGADGVFLDEAGYDFGVTRERQNAAVTAAHALGLSACLNAFRPADIFSAARASLNAVGGGNPRGLEAVVTARDAVLLEAFAVREGTPESADAMTARVRSALDGRVRFGTRIFGIATGGARADDASLAAFGWWAAALLGIDAYGWAAPAYGAATSELRWTARPDAEAALAHADYLAGEDIRDARWRRATTAGTIVLDLAGRRGSLELR